MVLAKLRTHIGRKSFAPGMKDYLLFQCSLTSTEKLFLVQPMVSPEISRH